MLCELLLWANIDYLLVLPILYMYVDMHMYQSLVFFFIHVGH